MVLTTEACAEVFNMRLALSSVGGDHEFLTEIVGLTKAAWPTLLAELRDCLDHKDLRAVGTAARLAKAAARNVSAKRAYDSASEVETVACKGDLPAAQMAVAQLEREVSVLQSFLETLVSCEYA